jgi:hypothetical protein
MLTNPFGYKPMTGIAVNELLPAGRTCRVRLSKAVWILRPVNRARGEQR